MNLFCRANINPTVRSAILAFLPHKSHSRPLSHLRWSYVVASPKLPCFGVDCGGKQCFPAWLGSQGGKQAVLGKHKGPWGSARTTAALSVTTLWKQVLFAPLGVTPSLLASVNRLGSYSCTQPTNGSASSQNAREASAPKLTAGLLTMFSVPVLWRKVYGWLYRAQWSLRNQLRVFFFLCFCFFSS